MKNITNDFEITLCDKGNNLVVVENKSLGIKYQFPNECENLESAEIHDNYILMIQCGNGRQKMIRLLE